MAGSSSTDSGSLPWRRASSIQPPNAPGVTTALGPAVRSAAEAVSSSSCGAAPAKASALILPVLPSMQVANPLPAAPDAQGSTTFSTAITATAASAAVPPCISIRRPAIDASGCPAATIPCGPATSTRCCATVAAPVAGASGAWRPTPATGPAGAAAGTCAEADRAAAPERTAPAKPPNKISRRPSVPRSSLVRVFMAISALPRMTLPKPDHHRPTPAFSPMACLGSCRRRRFLPPSAP